jgi:serine/threonine protein kinase
LYGGIVKIPDSVPWISTGKTLGSGGQGRVHLVTRRDQSDENKYALKELKSVDSPQARERFQREIEAVKSLDCASIAKIIDHSRREDHYQYYVMEFYDGAKTLDEIIFEYNNPYHCEVLKCLKTFEQLILALHACDQSKSPIVHRDIKPENILILPDGTIRLIDFGICQIQDGRLITLTDENLGTRNYAPLECEAGNNLPIGAYSDLYSAGKVLWSMVTSRPAFAREEPVFTNLSMVELFPDNPTTYHLNRIFQTTIRAKPSDRCQIPLSLLALIREITFLVQSGYPPLEEVVSRCPACGQKGILPYQQGHAVFGNPNPVGVDSIHCSVCGFIFVRDMSEWQRNYERFRNLT